MNDPDVLLAKAERGNRIANIARGMLALLIIAVLGFQVVATNQTNQQLRQQLEASQKQNQRQAADTQRVIAEIQHQSDLQTAYIRCIAKFFARIDRPSLTLDSLDNCSISGVPQMLPAVSKPTQPVPAPRSASATPSPTSSPAPVRSSRPTPTPTPNLPSSPIRAIIELLGF